MPRKLITVPDARLRTESRKVRKIDEYVLSVIADLRAVCKEWERAHPFEISAAIAAPQLGENIRVILVREDFDADSNADYLALINPEVLKTEGKSMRDYEGCLSVPEIYALVPRPKRARVKATLEDGREIRIKVDGFLARTLLHEIDHLNGVLFIDHVRNNKEAFFRLDRDGELVPADYEREIARNKELWGEE